MNLALAYDFETSGMPLWNEPSEDPRQPHIVQLGACLVDLDTRKTLASIDVIVKPDGWTIPNDVAAIHGITTELAGDVGIAENVALDMVLELWAERERIGHNESFDARIARIALKRFRGDAEADRWKAGRAQCTAVLATPLSDLIGAKTTDHVALRHLGQPLHLLLVDDRGWETQTVDHGGGHFEFQPTRALKPINARATELYRANCQPGTTHQIAGDVFVCPDEDFA